jgi:hypothetical protein
MPSLVLLKPLAIVSYDDSLPSPSEVLFDERIESDDVARAQRRQRIEHHAVSYLTGHDIILLSTLIVINHDHASSHPFRSHVR